MRFKNVKYKFLYGGLAASFLFAATTSLHTHMEEGIEAQNRAELERRRVNMEDIRLSGKGAHQCEAALQALAKPYLQNRESHMLLWSKISSDFGSTYKTAIEACDFTSNSPAKIATNQCALIQLGPITQRICQR